MFESGRESWYNVCKTDIIPWRIWFSRSPRKSRRSNLPEGYRSRRVRYNVCKTDIIPWRIWLLPSCKIPDARIYRRMVMPKQYIKIRGANEHNLKNISVDIPRNELVVLTGLSGSGKSSLAFDTIYACLLYTSLHRPHCLGVRRQREELH